MFTTEKGGVWPVKQKAKIFDGRDNAALAWGCDRAVNFREEGRGYQAPEVTRDHDCARLSARPRALQVAGLVGRRRDRRLASNPIQVLRSARITTFQYGDIRN